MPGTQKGYLLIADITGYTQYLSVSELDHAQQTLAILLEILVKHTRPPLVLSRLAGDAVISYGLQDHFLKGQSFLEMIEDTYVAFRRAIEQMVLNNQCTCNACVNIATLDLKFFVHYGAFAIQHINDHDELVGSDVNLIHRLLKNQVTELTGFRGYTLYTDAVIHQLGIEEISAGMAPHDEQYEHLGSVRVWVQDMHPIWQQKRDASRITIPPERVLVQSEIEIGLSREIVWDFLIRPEYRQTLMGSDRLDVTHRSHGRVAEGSVYRCYHGDTLIPQTVLEWQPFERILTQDVMPIPIPNVTALTEIRLEPAGSGTRMVVTLSRASGALVGRLISDRAIRGMVKRFSRQQENFKARLESDYRAPAVENAPAGLQTQESNA